METLHDIKFDHKRSCGKVMFLHLSVILFTGGGREGVCPPPPWMQTPKGWADLPRCRTTMVGQTSPDADPPHSDPPWVGQTPHTCSQQAGGTHPTGIHTCLYIFLVTSEAKIHIPKRKLTRLQFNKRMTTSQIFAVWNSNATEHNYKS